MVLSPYQTLALRSKLVHTIGIHYCNCRAETMKKITSADNLTYRRLLSLLDAAGVKKHGEYLLAGRKLVPEFAAHAQTKLNAIITTEAHREAHDMVFDLISRRATA